MENQANEPIKKTTHKSNVPYADLDLGTLLTNVSEKYAASSPQLPWITAAQALQLAADYQADLHTRQTEGGKRKPITQQLKEADKYQDEKVAYIKNYFIEKYGKKNAPSYYTEMGFEKVGTGYGLPRDRDRRIESLRKIVEALTTHGFTSQTYGVAFWTTLKTDYTSLASQAREKDSLIASKVSNKNNLKEQGKTFLNAVVNLLKALYPHDYRSKLREWGFQKEKY